MKKIASAILAILVIAACFCTTVFADTQPCCVTDGAAILEDDEISALEERAQEVSEQYGCGVYIITIDDFTEYTDSGDIEAFGKELFGEYELGLGDDNCGIALMLSMSDRSYALVAHGEFANTAFTDYGKETLAELFLDDFRHDDWFQGFADYIDGCADYMQSALDGEPEDIYAPDQSAGYDDYYDSYDLGFFWRLTHTVSPVAWLIIIGIPAIVALTVCMIMRAKMKSAVKGYNADRYISGSGIELTRRNDYYTHTTVTRTQVESEQDNSSFGGTSIDSDGYSSSSGKF